MRKHQRLQRKIRELLADGPMLTAEIVDNWKNAPPTHRLVQIMAKNRVRFGITNQLVKAVGLSGPSEYVEWRLVE